MGIFNRHVTWNIAVPGINCEHCEAKVTDALSQIPGVVNVKASAQEKRVTLRVDGKTPPAEATVHSALENAGYPATLS